MNIIGTMAAITCISLLNGSVPVAAQPRPLDQIPPPSIFRDLVECRSLTDPVKRLACYDQRVVALDVAERKRDVVIVDRKQINDARKTLFGLTLPTLHLFGLDSNAATSDKDDEDVQQIDSKIESASQNGDRWVIVMVDGARWQQTDDSYIDPPKAGQPVHIRKVTFGSFFANVNRQPAIRMRRLN